MPAMPEASATATSGPTEEVIRPTGLRHGRFEAHEWAFWTMGAIVLVAAIFYGLVRVGIIDLARLRRKT
jgi:hypothetical protein